MYPLADMLTRIRNALLVNKKKVEIPFSVLRLEVAKVLKREGYIDDFAIEEDEFKKIIIDLRYYKEESVIRKIRVVSKPGRRVYSKYKNLYLILGGLGDLIISTPQGVLTSKEARKRKLGGEILLEVY